MPPQHFEVVPLTAAFRNPLALRPVTAHLQTIFGDTVEFVWKDDVPFVTCDGCYLLEVHDINVIRRVPRILQSHGLGALLLE